MDSPTEDDEPIDLTLARKNTFKKQVNLSEYVGANLVLNRKSLNQEQVQKRNEKIRNENLRFLEKL